MGPDGILIASAADGTPARTSAANWQTFIEVPPLTNELRVQLVKDTLARYRKSLPDDLAQRLATAPQSGSPLFLSLALEELRLDARHETLVPIADEILKQPDAEQLFLNRFLLDVDNGRPELPELAACFMALLGASRAGLSENELADLLAQPNDPIAEDTGKPRLPQVYLSRLLNNLAPFLLNKEGRRAPMHRIFGVASQQYYGTVKVREQLYAHFHLGFGKGDEEYEPRAAAEALYQLTKISKSDSEQLNRLYDDLAGILTATNLYTLEEELLFDALSMFTFEGKSSLGEGWVRQADGLLKNGLEELEEWLGGYASWLFNRIGLYPAALGLQEKILESNSRCLGEDHPRTRVSMSNLALTLCEQGNLPRAMELQEKVLESRCRILGEDHPDTIGAMSSLANTLEASGDLQGARELKEKALKTCRRILGDEHLDTVDAMNDLANSLFLQGNLPQAQELHEKVLESRRRLQGEEHPITLDAMSNLANSVADLGDLVGARELRGKVLESRRRILGDEHPKTLSAMRNFAFSVADLGDLVSALELRKRVLESSRSILGDKHPETIAAMDDLAISLCHQGQLTEARSLLEQALESSRCTLGEEHPKTISSMHNLASTLRAQGVITKARKLAEKVLESRCRILGDEHPETLEAMSNLANILGDQGDILGARKLEEKVMESRCRVLGDEHPKTLDAMSNLAITISQQGNHLVARELHEKVLESRRRILGDEHPNTLDAMSNLAKDFFNQGELMEARSQFEQVLESSCRTLGEDHPGSKVAKDNLNICIRKLEKIERHNNSSTIIQHGEIAISMRITSIVAQWFEEQEWEERPTVNEEKQTSSTGFGYQVSDDYSVKCYLDAAENQGNIKLFMYFNETKIPESKIKEATRFVNMVNVGIGIGHLVVIPDERCLRYYAGIDVENATLEPRHISNLLNAGLRTMEKRLPQLMAICFGGKSAEEAIET